MSLEQRGPKTLKLTLVNLTQTDGSPYLSLPCPPFPNLGTGGLLRSAQQDLEVENALANDPAELQSALDILRGTDTSFL